MWKDFKAFLVRGNAVDLAVAVVVASAFGAVVTALVKDLITPLVTAIGGHTDFSHLAFRVQGSTFYYGDFLNSLISFLTISAVVFFFVVKPMNALMKRFSRGEEKSAVKDPQLTVLEEIRDELRRGGRTKRQP